MSTSLLSDQRIVITGASGFLGSHLSRRLLDVGAEVHAVSRSQRNEERQGLTWWQADMADIGAASSLLTALRPSVIYHLAGLSTAVPEAEFVLPILHSQLVSTVNVLTIANKIGDCRVVLAASLTEPAATDPHPAPNSPYAAAKWASSGYARMFQQLYGLPIVTVRPFMTYGPAQDRGKILPYVITSLLRGESARLSSGKQKFDWIYIDDVIDGLLAAGGSPHVDGCPIDLGCGEAVSVHDIVTDIVRLSDATARPLFGALPDRPFEQERVADTADAYERLGWKARTTLATGLLSTVDWYREQARGSFNMVSRGAQ